jgi:hypothetical protein
VPELHVLDPHQLELERSLQLQQRARTLAREYIIIIRYYLLIFIILYITYVGAVPAS